MKLNTILLIIGISILSYNAFMIYNLNEKENIGLEENYETECTNLSLEETAYCLRDYIKAFYNYTIRNDTEKTLEDIKLNGGDCYDYSNLYKNMAEQLNFSATTTTIFRGDKSAAHMYTTVWDKELNGYCILDQSSVWCWKGKVKNED